MNPEKKKCPACAENILRDALVCRFCGAVLTERELPAFVALHDKPRLEKALDPEKKGPTPVCRDAITPEAMAIQQAFTQQHQGRLQEFMKEGEEEYRNASILFVDVTGYTALSEKFRTEYVKDMLDAFYQVCSQAITSHNGFIVKFEGDACLAVFGAPVAYDRDVEACLRAAMEIRDAVDAFPPLENLRLEVSAGVATGEVLISFTERHGIRDFDVFGPTVNLAARIESSTPAGDIQVDPHTREQVAGVFEFQEQGPKKFKNVAQPICTYSLQGDRQGQLERRDFSTPYVGRQEERESLENCWKAFEDSPKMDWQGMRVSGMPGIGKSRILNEFLARREIPHYCLQAESSPQDLHQPYGMWREAFGKIRMDRPELFQGLGLRALFTEPEALQQARKLGPSVMDRHILSDIRGLLKNLTAEKPVILFLDDMQWSDSSSLAMLGKLLQAPPIPRLFLLLAHRSEWQYPHDAKQFPELTLKELSRDERRELADRIFPSELISEALLDAFAEQSGGNPLFLVEIVRAVMEQLEALDEEEKKDLSKRLKEWVPRSLRGLMQSRIDLLERKRRQVLQCGSVLGRRFSYQFIQFFQIIRDGLMARLYALRGLEFLDDIHDARELEFIFRHHLMRETSYQSLLDRQRRELHLTVAEELEERFEENLEPYYATLAFHYEQGEVVDQAARYWRMAGEQAQIQGALPDALDAFNHTLELWASRRMTETRQRMWWAVLRQKGRALRLLGKLQEALEVFEQGLKQKEPLGKAEFLTEKAVTLCQVGLYDEAKRALTGARRTVDLEKTDMLLWAMVETTWGTCNLGQGKWEKARKAYQNVLKRRLGRGQVEIQVDARNNLALIDWRQGRLEEALQGFRKAWRYWKRVNNPFGTGAVRMNMGIIEETRGRFAAAKKAYEEAHDIAQKVYFPQLETAVTANLGNLLHGQGNYAEAMNYNGQSLEMARAIGDGRSEAIALENLALDLIALGDGKKAEAYCRKGIAIARKLGDRDRLFSLELVALENELEKLPRMCGEKMRREKIRKIQKMVEELEGRIKEGGHHGEAARFDRLKVHAAFEAGSKEAKSLFARALKKAEKQGWQVERKRMEELQSRFA